MARKKSEKPVDENLLYDALESTGVVEILRFSLDKNTAKVFFRVKDKRTWLGILEYVMSKAEGWSAHVCQQYFMRGGKLVFGWNLILQSDALEQAVGHVSALIRAGVKEAPKIVSRGQLDSFPLVGPPRYRTTNIQFDPRLPGPSRGGPSHKGGYTVRSEG